MRKGLKKEKKKDSKRVDRNKFYLFLFGALFLALLLGFFIFSNKLLPNITGNSISEKSINGKAFFLDRFSSSKENSILGDSIPACGNGLVELGEECEDFNNINGDGCSATCTLENKGGCSFGYADRIFQYNITWYFDKCYRVGQFANGDYWVKTDESTSYVNITRISPDYLSSSQIGTSPASCTADSNCNQQFWVNDDYGTYSLFTTAMANNDYAFSRGSCGPDSKCHYFVGVHGWEVNPLVEPDSTKVNSFKQDNQPFDSRAAFFNESLMPSFPYLAHRNESILKLISQTGTRPAGKVAAVLTVVGDIPPDNGTTVFRPAYVGTNKTYYSINSLHTELLPSFASVANTPSIKTLFENFKRVHMDHKTATTGYILRSSLNMYNYYPQQANLNAEAILRLMLNDNLADKLPLLYVVVQAGIDNYYFIKEGQIWQSGGGVEPGHEVLPSFAATMLNDSFMRTIVRNFSSPNSGIGYLSYDNRTGRTLYGYGEGQSGYYGLANENRYWESIVDFNLGDKERGDPYLYTDGGSYGGARQSSYQGIMTPTWKGESIAFYLLPEMKNSYDLSRIYDYVDRFVNLGGWTQPDPCASPAGFCGAGPNVGASCTLANENITCGGVYCLFGVCQDNPSIHCGRMRDDNYLNCSGGIGFDKTCKINSAYYGNVSSALGYGPDPLNPGKCILDKNLVSGSTFENFECQDGKLCGRSPLTNGFSKDSMFISGVYSDLFVNSMWDAYRGESCYDGKCDAGENSTNCAYDCDPSTILRIDFEGNWSNGIILDKSGRGNNGDCNVTRDACPIQVTLADGTHAAKFNGARCVNSSDFITVNKTISLDNLSSGTLSIWAYYNDWQAYVYQHLFDAHVSYVPYGWSLLRDHTDYTTLLAVDPLTASSGGETRLGKFSDEYVIHQEENKNSSWNLYTVTWNSSVVKYYFNGVFIGQFSQQNITPLKIAGDSLVIGALKHELRRDTPDSNCVSQYFCVDLCYANCPPYDERNATNCDCTDDPEVFKARGYPANFTYCPANPPTYYIQPNAGFFNGYMDDLVLYNKPLEASKISQYYESTLFAHALPVCGNNMIQIGEVCDGTQLSGNSCGSFGFTYGTLKCKTDCSDYDSSYCSNVVQTCNNCNAIFGSNCDVEKCHYLGTQGSSCYFNSGNCVEASSICPSITRCSEVNSDECGVGICSGKLDCLKLGDSCIDLDASTEAYWNFNEGTGLISEDSSKNSNDGTLINNASWVNGRISNAINFNGIDNYVEINNNAGLPIYRTTGYSVTFWMNGTSAGNMDQAIYAEGSNLDGGNTIFRIGPYSSSTKNIGVQIRNSSGATKLYAGGNIRNVTNGKWHFIAWTDNNGTAKLYVDGVLDSNNFNYSPGTGVMTINRYCVGALCRVTNNQYFNGSVDEVGLYSRVLNASEILYLYNGTSVSQSTTCTNCKYIRAGATGSNDGSDWNNAYKNFSSVVWLRNYTYYVASGDFRENVFISKAASGNQWITLKKAVESEHGTSTGWNTNYGIGKAIINGTIYIDTSYININGVTGNENVNHGIKVIVKDCDKGSYGIHLGQNNPHIYLSHIEIQQCGEDLPLSQIGVYSSNYLPTTDQYFGYLYLHDISRDAIDLIYVNNAIIEHNRIEKVYTSYAEPHSQPIYIGIPPANNLTFRFNQFIDGSGTGAIVLLGSNGDIYSNISIYGNIFYSTNRSKYVYSPGAIYGRSGVNQSNVLIYSNTFYNIYNPATFLEGDKVTDSESKNNIYVNSYFGYSPYGTNNGLASSNNFYYNNTGNGVPVNEIAQVNGVVSPFVNASSFDLHLKNGSSAIDSGIDLGVSYNLDADGVTRPRGNGWDIGVYESNYFGSQPICGNNIIESGEECDPPTALCSPAYGSSCKYCNSQCRNTTLQGGYCGDNLLNGNEVCENNQLSGKTCTNLLGTTYSGVLSCLSNCLGYNTSLCVYYPGTNCTDADRDGWLDYDNNSQSSNYCPEPLGKDKCVQINFEFNSLKPDFGNINSSYNFSSGSNGDFRNITEFKMFKPNQTEVRFNKPLKLIKINSTGCFVRVNITPFVNISYLKIEIDSDNLSELNEEAQIIFDNVSLVRPIVLRDKAVCGSYCSYINYNSTSKSYIVNVTGFSTYELVEQCSNSIQDVDETGVDCGGSCSACSSPPPGGGGGGGSGGGNDGIPKTNLNLTGNNTNLTISGGSAGLGVGDSKENISQNSTLANLLGLSKEDNKQFKLVYLLSLLVLAILIVLVYIIIHFSNKDKYSNVEYVYDRDEQK